MNNKGFTLIELLATIALLAVIVSISFITINSVIKKNKENNCKTLINNIKSASNEYISDNRYNKDLEVNNYTVTITAQKLVNEYLNSPIKDPFSSEDIIIFI